MQKCCLKQEAWAVTPAHVDAHWLWPASWVVVHVTSQVFPSRAVFIGQGQAFRESASVSRQLPAPATAGGGCAGPGKGLWAGHQPYLFYLVSYLRGRNVSLGFGDYLDFCFVHCPTALHCRKTSWWFSGALCPPSDIQPVTQ